MTKFQPGDLVTFAYTDTALMLVIDSNFRKTEFSNLSNWCLNLETEIEDYWFDSQLRKLDDR